MEYQEYSPARYLSKYIRCYWTVKLKLENLKTDKFLFPSRGYMDLDFNIKGTVIRRNNSVESVCKAGYVCGVNTDFIEVDVLNDLEIFGVRFCHGGTFSLFNTQPRDFTGLNINTGDIPGGDELTNKILDAKDIMGRITIIESFIVNNTMHDNFDERVSHSIQTMKTTRGSLSIDELARHVNLSQRQFRRRFLSYTGVTPKSINRIIRFQHILSAYRLNDKKKLWQVADDCGYVDKSHIVKDFKYFTKKSPVFFIDQENDIVKKFNKL